MERQDCALLSREFDESLAGTAPLASGWIALEHPGPWTPKAPTAAEIGPLAAHLDVDDVRVQLIRPIQHLHVPLPQPTGHTVVLAHGAVDPADRWMERLHVPDLADLLGLDPRVVLSPRAPGLGTPIDHDVWLVCTHARRDACCAVHGRPVAAALDAAGSEVWETTHTGGHRFAATAVLLPDGLSLGRLDTVDPVAVAADLTDGTLPTELVRGRCGLPRAAQAAEVALRQHLGVTGRDDVTVRGHHAGDGRGTTVLLDGAGARWRTVVERRPASAARPVSDGADPTHPDEHDVGPMTTDDPTGPTGPPIGTRVWIDERKYPATGHWRFPATVLGSDEQGTWLGVPTRTVAQRGDEPPRMLPIAMVVLVPRDDPWLVECYEDHPGVATYVNIGSVPRWQGDRVTQLDLDLDVVVELDGTVRVLDRDDLDQHRVTLGYPDDLVADAEAAAARAVALLEADPDAFDAAPWFARLAELA